MFNIYSKGNTSKMQDELIAGMAYAERFQTHKFSFTELTSVLVKCAEAVEGDMLSDSVDDVLVFVEQEFLS